MRKKEIGILLKVGTHEEFGSLTSVHAVMEEPTDGEPLGEGPWWARLLSPSGHILRSGGRGVRCILGYFFCIDAKYPCRASLAANRSKRAAR